ncbi:MAG TPA: ABC transporter ATP-binding protein [Acidobacteriota bacterium]|jgi:ABC-2 type transport system ATP-binding protein|nr:ABC transporter ATP-binding protein [Acidobacteriota bacterium]
MSNTHQELITFDNVSKFYGEVLGVNRVSLSITPGITSLVGPNGAGKTTLMNLMTGLLKPTQGTITVLGVPAERPEDFCRNVGYCSQFDSFPKGLTGYDFIYFYLRVRGCLDGEARQLTLKALEGVNMMDAASRRVAGYSKGMRQRIKLAQALSHQPSVLVLDEPLNGLDPMARAEVIDLFQKLGRQGLHVIISSHILHEVDRISDRVVLLSNGYVVAEGDIHDVRGEMEEHPLQILVRCDRPSQVASRVFQLDHVVEVKLQADGRGLLVKTRNPDQFYLLLNRVVVEDNLSVEAVTPADDDVNSVYQYLIGKNGA